MQVTTSKCVSEIVKSNHNSIEKCSTAPFTNQPPAYPQQSYQPAPQMTAVPSKRVFVKYQGKSKPFLIKSDSTWDSLLNDIHTSFEIQGPVQLLLENVDVEVESLELISADDKLIVKQ
jgi:hypothetical protein